MRRWLIASLILGAWLLGLVVGAVGASNWNEYSLDLSLPADRQQQIRTGSSCEPFSTNDALWVRCPRLRLDR